MLRLTANFVGRVRRATENGRPQLVAPMTLIVPGVLDGSNGPILYPPDEIAKHPSMWNGIPLTVYHPMVNGRPGLAKDWPSIGTVRNARANGSLTAEGWFDVERTRTVDARVLRALEMGEPMELSTGLFLDSEPVSGTHNGRPYVSIARNFRPDHVAVLPDQVGACSLRDGCGVHNYQMENFMFCNASCECPSCAVKRYRAEVAITVNASATLESPTPDWGEPTEQEPITNRQRLCPPGLLLSPTINWATGEIVRG